MSDVVLHKHNLIFSFAFFLCVLFSLVWSGRGSHGKSRFHILMSTNQDLVIFKSKWMKAVAYKIIQSYGSSKLSKSNSHNNKKNPMPIIFCSAHFLVIWVGYLLPGHRGDTSQAAFSKLAPGFDEAKPIRRCTNHQLSGLQLVRPPHPYHHTGSNLHYVTPHCVNTRIKNVWVKLQWKSWMICRATSCVFSDKTVSKTHCISTALH